MIAAVIVIVTGAACRAETFSLKEALAVAYSTNPKLEAARAQARAADERVAESRGGWRPNLGISGSYGYDNQYTSTSGFSQDLQYTPTSGQATLSQPLFTGGQVYADVQRAIAGVDQARANLLLTEQQTLLATATAYMNVVRDETVRDRRHGDVDVLYRQRSATETELNAGEATRTDMSEVEVRLARAEAELALAEAQLVQSRDFFERTIGRPPEKLEDFPALPALPSSQEKATALALHSSPQLLAARASDRAAKYSVDVAVGALLPHASVVAQYNYSQNALSSGFPYPVKTGQFSIMGQVSVPIYAGGAEEARVREAKELHSQAGLGILDADGAVRQSVKDSWAALDAAKTAFKLDQQRVASSKSALDGVTEQQHEGERSVLDILNAEDERLQAEVDLAGSRRDVVVTAYQVLSSTGQLTARTLRLPVKLYNPEQHYDEDAGKWFGLGK